MTKIKLCGMTRPEDVEAANRCRPDFIGFVFASSRRQVTPEQAAWLRTRLAPGIRAAGVFVNAPLEQIEELWKEKVIDLVQLHGDEDNNFLKKLKERVQAPVIRAVRVQTAEQVVQAEQTACDALLLDAAAAGQYGGSGRRFDLSLIPPLQKPFFVAGGLDESNVIQVIKRCRPWGVDVSSGIETDGKKDPEKMARLVRLVREEGKEEI